MKRFVKSKVGYPLAILLCQAASCSSPQQNVAPVAEKIVYREDVLEGVRVLVPTSISKDVFYPGPVKVNDPNAREAANTLSLDDLARIAEPIVDRYPDLGSIPLRDEDLQRIMHDFPDLKDERSVREKSDVVIQYYNGLMSTEFKPAINQATKNRGGKKAAGFGDLNALELQHLSHNASMVGGYRNASIIANRENEARFITDNADGERGNAFKHAVWNCLIIREALYRGYSKNNAVLFTRNITSDHERDDNGDRRYSDNEAMDLHNNLSARSWMNNNSSGSVWPFSIRCPSEGDIFAKWESSARSNSFHVCSTVAAIIPLFDWEYLYSTATGNMGDRLYYYRPQLGGC